MDNAKLEIIFAEFGQSRANAGDASLPVNRLEPSLSSFRRHFPKASFTVYTDQDWQINGVRVVKVDTPFDKRHPRYGNRCNDYYGPYGIIQSAADVALSIDSDLLVVNPDVWTLIPLVLKFGLCSPSGGRHILWRDARSPLDGGPVEDESRGCGAAHCTAFIAMRTDFDPGRQLMQAYCDQIVTDSANNRGARGPLSLWRASWKTGVAPYTLPREWCITGSNLGDSEAAGRTIPIALHVGHESVRKHYAAIVEKWS